MRVLFFVLRRATDTGSNCLRAVISPISCWWNHYRDWWLEDFPPISGRLRCVFYTGLLVASALQPRSALRLAWILAETSPVLYQRSGLWGALAMPSLPSEAIYAVLLATVVAWVFAALGLFTRASSIVTAAGGVLLYGVTRGINSSHSWYLPMYALVLLCWARMNNSFALDVVLFKRKENVGDTGFARKAILVAAVGLLFSAGLNKLLDAGPRWIDGRTLQHFLRSQSDLGVIPSLNVLLAERLWACSALSTFSLMLELLAPVALFSGRGRRLIIISHIAFLIGIRLVMFPDFLSHLWCYVLFIDWPTVRTGLLRGFQRAAWASTAASPLSANTFSTPTPRRQAVLVGLGTVVLLVSHGVAFLRVDWWPLTSAPMYSGYIGQGIFGGVLESELGDAVGTQQVFRKSTWTWTLRAAILERQGLRLTARGRKPKPVLFKRGSPLANALIVVIRRELSERPLSEIKPIPGSSADQFVRALVPEAKRMIPGWEPYTDLEITYKLERGPAVLASAPLSL